MKVVHVISLLDPEMSFGGPTRVALNQLKALRKAGHEVLLVAGVQGFDPRTLTEYDGVPVKAFKALRIPGIGFAGLFAPKMLGWLARVALAQDQIHIHLARDLVSAPAGWLLKFRRQHFVLQTHGMIDESGKLLAKLLDALVIRGLLRSADAVLALTEKERDDLVAVEPKLRNPRILPNGLARSRFRVASDGPVEVLFLARLQERKRPLEFVRAAQRLAAEFPEAIFSVAGPDGGQLDGIRTALETDDGGGRIRYIGSVPAGEVRQRMSRCSVYVLPSFNEPFGMTVLEAMSTGLAVVTMEDCGLAALVRQAGGEAVGYRDGELADGIRRLLADDDRRRNFALRAPELVDEKYGLDRVTEELAGIYLESSGKGQ